MYKLLYAFLLLFPAATLLGQHAEPPSVEDRLLEAFEPDYLETLRTRQPAVYQRLAFYLDHAWYITDFPSEKGANPYPVIELPDPERFNIFLVERAYDLKRDYDQQTYYQIAGTNKVLVFHAGKRFNRMLNEHLGRSYDASRE